MRQQRHKNRYWIREHQNSILLHRTSVMAMVMATLIATFYIAMLIIDKTATNF